MGFLFFVFAPHGHDCETVCGHSATFGRTENPHTTKSEFANVCGEGGSGSSSVSRWRSKRKLAPCSKGAAGHVATDPRQRSSAKHILAELDRDDRVLWHLLPCSATPQRMCKVERREVRKQKCRHRRHRDLGPLPLVEGRAGADANTARRRLSHGVDLVHRPQATTGDDAKPNRVCVFGVVPSSSACVSAGPDEEQSGSASSSAASDGKEIIIVRSNTRICPHIHCCVRSLLGCVLQRLTHIGVLATKARTRATVCGTGASARSCVALPSPRVLCLGAPICERKAHRWTQKLCAVLEKSRVKDINISSWDPTVVS